MEGKIRKIMQSKLLRIICAMHFHFFMAGEALGAPKMGSASSRWGEEASAADGTAGGGGEEWKIGEKLI